jgi:hypothetical protein
MGPRYVVSYRDTVADFLDRGAGVGGIRRDLAV